MDREDRLYPEDRWHQQVRSLPGLPEGHPDRLSPGGRLGLLGQEDRRLDQSRQWDRNHLEVPVVRLRPGDREGRLQVRPDLGPLYTRPVLKELRPLRSRL